MSGIVQTQKVNGHLVAVFPQTMIPHRGVECSSATVGSSCLHFPRLLISLILFPPSTPSFSSPIFGLCLLSVVHNSALSSCPLFASFNLLLSSIQRKFRLIFVLSQLSVLNPRHFGAETRIHQVFQIPSWSTLGESVAAFELQQPALFRNWRISLTMLISAEQTRSMNYKGK